MFSKALNPPPSLSVDEIVQIVKDRTPEVGIKYWVMLYDPKGEMISKKLLRVYPGRGVEAEMLGKQIGFELGRDAFDDLEES
jgi:hypothetical protein